MSETTEVRCECLVYTFKEGLLSRIAHDLKLRFNALHVDWNPTNQTIVAKFDTASLQVICARDGGTDDQQRLSQRDRDKIEASLRKDVLQCRRFPNATFHAAVRVDAGSAELDGTLTLCGVKKNVQLQAKREGERWVTRYKLHQPDFGIVPFSAALGTLKVKPDVLIEVAAAGPIAQ